MKSWYFIFQMYFRDLRFYFNSLLYICYHLLNIKTIDKNTNPCLDNNIIYVYVISIRKAKISLLYSSILIKHISIQRFIWIYTISIRVKNTTKEVQLYIFHQFPIWYILYFSPNLRTEIESVIYYFSHIFSSLTLLFFKYFFLKY